MPVRLSVTHRQSRPPCDRYAPSQQDSLLVASYSASAAAAAVAVVDRPGFPSSVDYVSDDPVS